MKITEAIKIIDDNWIEKPKGFRVCMQRREGSEWVNDYSPGEKAAPLDSDVTTWRLAWKLAEAGRPEEKDGKKQEVLEGRLVLARVRIAADAPLGEHAEGLVEGAAVP